MNQNNKNNTSRRINDTRRIQRNDGDAANQ